MAFGLSEREHGADVYNTDMVLTPASEEDRANGILYRASGEKYYIGNGNVASMVSVFGAARATCDGPATATCSSPPTAGTTTTT